METTRYVIFGAGAIGATIGAALHLSGHEVALIARGANFDALSSDGLDFVHGDDRSLLHLDVVNHPTKLDFRAEDVVVLAMKGQDTPGALEALREAAPPTTPIICAQNGVENERAALRDFASVHGMCVLCPATHLAPGEVVAHSAPIIGSFDLGLYPAGIDAVDEAFATALSASSCEAIARDDVMAWKYAKLIRNLGNALEALFPASDDRVAVAEQARAEAVACLERAGIATISATTFDERQRRIRTQAPGAPLAGVPLRGGGSTWQSLARGTGTVETDYLNGEIVLLGRLHGIPTPVNALLQQMSAEAARERREPGSLPLAAFHSRLRASSGTV